MMKMILTYIPKELRDKPEFFRALGVFAIFLLILVAQLFKYEAFYPIIESFHLPGGRVSAVVMTILLPLLTFMALPYLMSMKLPARFWLLSRGSAVAVPVIWLLIFGWLNISGNTLREVGILGATITMYYNIWSFVFLVLLLLSVVVVVRELSPRKLTQ